MYGPTNGPPTIRASAKTNPVISTGPISIPPIYSAAFCEDECTALFDQYKQAGLEYAPKLSTRV